MDLTVPISRRWVHWSEKLATWQCIPSRSVTHRRLSHTPCPSVRDGRPDGFRIASPHGPRLARQTDPAETGRRLHHSGSGGGGRDFPAGGPEAPERLPGLRPSDRGGASGGQGRAHLPPLAPAPVPGQATSHGQGAWWSAEVQLWAAVRGRLEFKRSFTPPRPRRNPLHLRRLDPRRRVRSSHIRSPRRRVRLWRSRSNQCRRTRWLE